MTQDTAQTQFYTRYLRPTVLVGGLAIYAAFTWGLLVNGYLHATASAYLQLLGVWVAGFVVLLFWPQRLQALDDETTVLLRALWCNIGVVAMACLVPHAIRFLLLVVPVFGVLYAGLYLRRSQVVLIAVMTWLFYLLCSLGLFAYTGIDEQFELLAAGGFAVLLTGGLLLSWEALRLRDVLAQRNAGLRDAMERMSELALKDELTGVHNRRYILEVLTRQKALADRGSGNFTLCFCDLDYFKRVNDQYGHAVGDVALRQFAQLAAGVVRNVDYVARFGGEEFLLVLVGAPEQAAANVARRLAERTREMWIPGTDDDFVLSVSIGVTRYRDGERVDDTLNRADRALYQAKQQGRNRVIVAAA